MILDPFAFIVLLNLVGAGVGVGVVYLKRFVLGEPLTSESSDMRASCAGW